MMTPTIVIGQEILTGFAQNRARLEELFPKPKEVEDGSAGSGVRDDGR